jgi:hypothetical protein
MSREKNSGYTPSERQDSIEGIVHVGEAVRNMVRAGDYATAEQLVETHVPEQHRGVFYANMAAGVRANYDESLEDGTMEISPEKAAVYVNAMIGRYATKAGDALPESLRVPVEIIQSGGLEEAAGEDQGSGLHDLSAE